MPYARFDDRYDDHRKIKRAWRRQPAAVALHAMAITYANRHVTDGLVDAEWVQEKLELLPFRSTKRAEVLTFLIENELFEKHGPDHYLIHDFLEWNLSKAQRLQLSKQGREGGKAKARLTHPDGPGSSKGQSQGQSEGQSEGSSTPTPTPTPTPKHLLVDADRADVENPDDVRLCAHLRRRAEERNPKFKVKSRTRWLNDMRLLRERDRNSPEDIERVIAFVFADEFWGGVIQSPGNLREHFPRIWDRMTRPAPLSKPEVSDLDAKRLAALNRLMNDRGVA